MVFHAVVRAGIAAIDAAEAVDRTLFLLPGYKPCRDLALDILLGPAEDVEYVSTTTPSPPPTPS